MTDKRVVTAVPIELRLQPSKGHYPLWADSTVASSAQEVDPSCLGLSDELMERIDNWNKCFQRTSPDHTGSNALANAANSTNHSVWGFENLEAERVWYETGLSIAADLGQELERVWAQRSEFERSPGKLVVRLSSLEFLIKQSRGDRSPWEWKAQDHVHDIAAQCGIPEIGRAIERLDELSIARANVPQWDGDTNDDIATAQLTFGQILGAMPSHYLDDITKGLESEHSDTRFYVAYGMAKHGKVALARLSQALEQEQDYLTRSMMEMLIDLIE